MKSSGAKIYLVVSDTARNPARSGIQMVVRALVERAARIAPERTRLVAWRKEWGGRLAALGEAEGLDLPDGGRLREAARIPWSQGAPGDLLARLVGAGGWGNRLPLARHPRHRDRLRGAWLLLPELVYRHISGADRPNQLLGWAQAHGIRVAAVLYDLLPVRHPEFSSAAHAELHAGYLDALARRADLLLPISQAVADDWQAWADARPADAFGGADGRTRPAVRVTPLAAELPGVPRQTATLSTPGRGRHEGHEEDTKNTKEGKGEAETNDGTTRAELPRALCVSTLEPRKNHAALLAALDRLAERHGGRLPLRLDLMGAAHQAGEAVRAAVEAAVARHPDRMVWHGQVDDARRRELYAACDFTVYPSFIEGFGLPVAESLWLGRPCVCARDGAVGENTVGGGCLPVDVRDPAALAAAMKSLALDPALRSRLASEAAARPLKTWEEYAAEVLSALDVALPSASPADQPS